jgi:type II secretory pathway component GspD/PulD (secretin)
MTVSTVPDGTTIILGGLESVAQSKLVKKVPILGDLPLVGGLFRDIDDSDSVGKLYVFVRANIIRPGDQVEGLEDIRRVSGKYREEFEEMEEKFQSMQDWPGIDSPPMDPVKVLEDDDFDVEPIADGEFVVQDSWPSG